MVQIYVHIVSVAIFYSLCSKFHVGDTGIASLASYQGKTKYSFSRLATAHLPPKQFTFQKHILDGKGLEQHHIA